MCVRRNLTAGNGKTYLEKNPVTLQALIHDATCNQM